MTVNELIALLNEIDGEVEVDESVSPYYDEDLDKVYM